MSEYENVLEQIRPFGPYQIRTFVLVSLFETPLAWAMLAPIFTASNPGVFCDTSQELNTTFWGLNKNQSKQLGCGKNVYCQTVPNISFLPDYTSIVSEWGLVCDKEYISDLITSLQMTGVLFGALITGQLADIFGRKKILFIEYGLLIVLWFCTGFAPRWEIYAALRFLVGGLIGGCLVVNFVLPLEFVTPAWRTFCGCIGFWAVGLMTLAPWAYLLRDWRTLDIAMSCSSVILLLLWWFIDESPRWLLSRGYLKEAEEIIVKAAKFNKRPVPDLSCLQNFVKREQIRKNEERTYSYWHLCSSFHLTKGSLICMFGWFVSSSVYYGHNFNSKNLVGNRYLNVFISGLVEIPALIFVLVSNNYFGRRKTVFYLMFISGLACFSILLIDAFVSSEDDLEKRKALTITMAMIGKSCISGGWAAVQIFSAETFPTVIRNIGIGACSMAARIGGIVAPQFGFLGQSSMQIPFTIFGILSVACSFLMLLLKETMGAPLPDRLHRQAEIASSSVQVELLVKDNMESNLSGNGDMSNYKDSQTQRDITPAEAESHQNSLENGGVNPLL